MKKNDRRYKTVMKITGVYLIFSALWIIFSDKFVEFIAVDERHLAQMQTYKGLFFILSTSLIIGIMINLEIKKREKMFKELQKAKEEAEEANKAKSEFLANMTHELRTPMTGIMGTLELMLMTDLDEEQKKYRDNLEYSTNILLKRINSILQMSKLEHESIEMENDSFELDNLIHQTIESFIPETYKKKLELLYYISSDIPNYLYGDWGKFQQILLNLIGNSVKFTDKGYIYLEISSTKQKSNSLTIKCSLTDTGIGISDDKKEVIFENFIQGDLSYSKKYQGTGLGLSISKQLIEALNGEISIESSLGKGTTMNFTAEFDINTMDKKNIENKIDEKLAKLDVLIVDTNIIFRNVLKNIINDIGINNVKIDINSKEVEKTLEKNNIDLVFIKIDNKIQNEILDIKKIDIKTKVIGILDYSNKKLINKLKNLYVDEIVVKPVSKKEIVNKIEYVYIDSLKEEKSKDCDSIDILVVEDDFMSQKILSDALPNYGYSIAIANNGNEAIYAVERNNYKVILMDIQMPDMNGVEVTKIIRNKEITTPIIALTAYSDEEEIEKFMKLGMQDYVSKPISLQRLNSCIKKYL